MPIPLPEDFSSASEEHPSGNVQRMFVLESGWAALVKQDNTREFCYHASPDSAEYHQLWYGEIFLQRAHERLCLNCATRRGIVGHERRHLRDPVQPLRSEVREEFPLEPPSTT